MSHEDGFVCAFLARLSRAQVSGCHTAAAPSHSIPEDSGTVCQHMGVASASWATRQRNVVLCRLEKCDTGFDKSTTTYECGHSDIARNSLQGCDRVLQALAMDANDGVYCSTSGTVFTNKESLAEHYKSDLHRYNLKRKVAGVSRPRQRL